MQRRNGFAPRGRRGLLLGTAIVSSLGWAGAAYAAEADNQLAEVVVTAQKREQSVQDVPIAVTALSGDTLAVNRIASVTDLSGLAPNVVVRRGSVTQNVPAFTVRGAVSYGVVAGSDKQVSIYLDGVYLSSPRGSLFDLPDVERIEMLRGPQGTLFGRNATAGAVSVTTRDPAGEFHVRQEITLGNYDQNRTRTSVDLPAMGPFSAYVSYVHTYQRGDIKNLGAGTRWDRTASPDNLGVQYSPKYLGTKDADAWFAAVKFAPNDAFSTVYKFDWNVEHGSPGAAVPVGLFPVGAAGALLSNTVNLQPRPVVLDPSAKRPKSANNSFTTPFDQKVYGHSLTSQFKVSDNITLKNIAAYRYSYIFAATQLDGLGGLVNVIPALGPVGAPFLVIGSQNLGRSKQWSDEFQLNYDSKLLTLTAGALWFHGSDRSGGLLSIRTTPSFATYPGGVIPIGSEGINYNRQTSTAAYVQSEFHVTSQLDVVTGARITKDKKSGEFIFGTPPALTTIAFNYHKTKPNWLLGVNYKPNEDVLLYGKFSTAFVSGGSVAAIDFKPETAKSFEGGVKADWLDKRLRTNLSVFQVTYKHLQTAQSASNFPALPNSAVAGTIVVDQGGPVKAKGFEFEGTALPAKGLTLGGSLGYTDTKFIDVSPVLLAANGGGYLPTLRPKWTSSLWGQYESDPLFNEARGFLRLDATYHSKQFIDGNPNRNAPTLAVLKTSPAVWIVNGRAAIRDIKIGGADVEVAAWARNLTNNKDYIYALIVVGVGEVNFQPARTFGIDVSVRY